MKICLDENKKFQSIAKIQNQHYLSYEADKIKFEITHKYDRDNNRGYFSHNLAQN